MSLWSLFLCNPNRELIYTLFYHRNYHYQYHYHDYHTTTTTIITTTTTTTPTNIIKVLVDFSMEQTNYYPTTTPLQPLTTSPPYRKGSVLVDFSMEQTNYYDDSDKVEAYGMRTILEQSLRSSQLGMYAATTDGFVFKHNGYLSHYRFCDVILCYLLIFNIMICYL